MLNPALTVLLVSAGIGAVTCLQAQSTFPEKAAPPLPREQLVEAIRGYIGTGPTEADIVDPQLEILEKVELEDHYRWHISYYVEADDKAYAYVLFPKPFPTAEKPAPLVLTLHSTTGWGKSVPAGVEENLVGWKRSSNNYLAQRQHAVDLVRMGFIAFAPDFAGYGERTYLDKPLNRFNENHVAHFKELWKKKWPDWRFPQGKYIWDLERTLDIIDTWPFVDHENIGAIGHSLGSWVIIYGMPVIDRIKAGVINAGGGLHFQRNLWEDQNALINFMNTPSKHNLHSMMNIFIMATAPRSVLYIKPLNDSAKYERSWFNHLEAYRIIIDYYKQVLEAEGLDPEKPQFDIYFHMEKHTFPPEARALAYAWLKRQLMP